MAYQSKTHACITSLQTILSVLHRLNGSHFDADKALPGQGSRDLDEEEGEELGAEEEEAENSDCARKPCEDGVPSSLDHDIINDDIDFEGPDDLENSKSSPQRFAYKKPHLKALAISTRFLVVKTNLCIVFRFNEDEDDEDQSSFSTLDHIRHFSMEDGDLSDSDVGSFGPAHLQEGIKQPLYRKSKSQVYHHDRSQIEYQIFHEYSLCICNCISLLFIGICYDAVSS